jgi:hypothetical protein
MRWLFGVGGVTMVAMACIHVSRGEWAFAFGATFAAIMFLLTALDPATP